MEIDEQQQKFNYDIDPTLVEHSDADAEWYYPESSINFPSLFPFLERTGRTAHSFISKLVKPDIVDVGLIGENQFPVAGFANRFGPIIDVIKTTVAREPQLVAIPLGIISALIVAKIVHTVYKKIKKSKTETQVEKAYYYGVTSFMNELKKHIPHILTYIPQYIPQIENELHAIFSKELPERETMELLKKLENKVLSLEIKNRPDAYKLGTGLRSHKGRGMGVPINY